MPRRDRDVMTSLSQCVAADAAAAISLKPEDWALSNVLFPRRATLAADEKFQADVIEAYLPKMMSEDEIRQAVQNKITEVGASGPQDMGKVMGPMSKELAGKADGKVISSIVKEELGKL